MKIATFTFTLIAAMPAIAQTITDGDTVRLRGIKYRLYAVDAPELRQVCPDGWPAGQLAKSALSDLADSGRLICERRGRDRSARAVGTCQVDGIDVGENLVRRGLAWADARYSRRYVAMEEEARAAGLGVHGHGCITAREWRARRR